MATDAKKITKGSHDAWNSHDVNRVLEFYTDDCVHEDVPYGIVSHGKKELTTFLNSSFVDFPDIKWELKSLFGAGDWVGKEWVMSGTHAHSRTPGVPQLPARHFRYAVLRFTSSIMVKLAMNQRITTW